MSKLFKTITNNNQCSLFNNPNFIKKRSYSNFVNPKLPDNNDLFMSLLAGCIGTMWTFPNCPENTEKEKTLSMFSKGIGFASFGISLHYLLRYLKKF